MLSPHYNGHENRSLQQLGSRGTVEADLLAIERLCQVTGRDMISSWSNLKLPRLICLAGLPIFRRRRMCLVEIPREKLVPKTSLILSDSRDCRDCRDCRERE